MINEQVQQYLSNFVLQSSTVEGSSQSKLFDDNTLQKTVIEDVQAGSSSYPKYVNEFWTSRQRQSNSIHEISYRACFKAQLPRFFIQLLTKSGSTVYDPFGGRGTTAIESALLRRNVISNDINPLSAILTYPRLHIPDLALVAQRLEEIPFVEAEPEIDLSMFYHVQTLQEILSIKTYLSQQRDSGKEDDIDAWIRMVATNRLTGHSAGFFSVYTLPPNQAISAEGQLKINKERGQAPDYRSTTESILRKSESLLSDVTPRVAKILREVGSRAQIITGPADATPIESESVDLTVTSPPFLNVIDYVSDNWLRLWFNSIDSKEVSSRITVVKTLGEWSTYMGRVFEELFRITKLGGWVAFEVGEVNRGKICLDEYVIPLAEKAGFICHGVVVNKQEFTKTANIWGVSNNTHGTNTNRIVLLEKRNG